MDAIFGLLGILGMVAGIIMAVFLWFTKRPEKTAWIVFLVSCTLFFIGLSLSPSSPFSELESSLKISQESFAEGMERFKEKEYEAAIELFEKVVEEDTENYPKAEEYVKKAEALLSQGLVERAKDLLANADYGLAIETAKEAALLNPDLEEETSLLIKTASRKQQEAERERKERERLERMKSWEGTGSARVAVPEVIAQSEFSGGYRTYIAESWAQFLRVNVRVLNNSQSRIHANPRNITLLCGNRVYNLDSIGYSMSDYFQATDLQPGTYTSGWVLFCVPKRESYILVYEGFLDETVKKEIVVTKTR
jgi:tetratricopeptide (TPR) repeat protein